MEKVDVVASLAAAAPGSASLLKPARMRAALKANDRLKLYLSLLQAAAAHARSPAQPALDLRGEIAAAGIAERERAEWLRELPAGASAEAGLLTLPDLPRLAACLHDDLGAMAQPLHDAADADPALAERVLHWQARLQALAGPVLDEPTLDALTHGRRGAGDSLHLTVMDLHKALNREAARLAGAQVEGASAWQLAEDGSDVARVAAFMRGVNRTRHLKGDHPGLDTAATRDGPRLMIQNDIGTNDAHVLVLQVDTAARPLATTLTYSDLHGQRFAFFGRQLEAVGAQWAAPALQQTAGLNAGKSYRVGTARFEAADEPALAAQLEGIGERIVFLIDWNRARKRLLAFVDRAGAVAVLEQAAERRAGHRAWLQAGGERLVWAAMAAQGAGVFRLGDRLDEVLGAEAARDFLADLLVLAQAAQAAGRPPPQLADEARALLARRLAGRRGDYDLLEEHGCLLQTIALELRDALAHGAERDAAAAAKLAARAKRWERQADQLVMRGRSLAERQPQWQPMVRLLEKSDDVADALEEAAFTVSLLAEHFGAGRSTSGWQDGPREALRALADAVLVASQDHLRALVIARTLGEGSEAADHDEYLDALWRVVQAERRCDELLRSARRALAAQARDDGDAVALALGNELAAAVELASDALLALVYGVRERAFRRIEGGGP